MRHVLQSDSFSKKELADALGFQNPKSLQGHLEALIRQKYLISDQPVHLATARFRINYDIPIIVKLYEDKHYKQLKVQIRAFPSLVDELMRAYSDIRFDLLPIIRSMIVCSGTFFEMICENRTPGQLMHTYRYLMYPYRLSHKYSEDLQFVFLIHELYSFALVQDMKGSDLAQNFCEPLKIIREMIKGEQIDRK